MLKSKRRMLALLALTAALAAILGIGVISNAELSALANSSARVQRSYDLLQTLYDLNAALTDTETNQRGFLLTGPDLLRDGDFERLVPQPTEL